MRGGWKHNGELFDPVADEFRRWGVPVELERRTGRGKAALAVDGCADLPDGRRVVVEAEGADGRTTRVRRERVAAYVAKSLALDADVLLIVVATGRVAAQVRRCLRALPRVPAGLEVVVRTSPQARAWVQRLAPVDVCVKGEKETRDNKERGENGTGRCEGRKDSEREGGDEDRGGRRKVEERGEERERC